ncbi:lytic polysaccharide monooxygenase auxiliary activity family 9 protein [Crossiella cryophila]|uniref:Chitin-binding protein n=1 Tax=Crossiella cryophila TaxID=43355 RepID=A0A7W7CI51_9PSEU|nr:lytic polysaccharide monooxygenase [Crossiella cryophila]MBB4679909.1 chitin-binding protein [Crossiella cryophila]
MARNRSAPRALLILTAITTLLAGLLTGIATAHGSVTDPPTRNYGCWKRWGGDHLNPAMATRDPMCWQAWQANPTTMWNWNGLYREHLNGNHRANIPNGQLCSGGRAENGRYNSLDAVGNWQPATKPRRFTLTLTDEAKHGADHIQVYATKPGYNPVTQPLSWDHLELLTHTGRYAPSSAYRVEVNAGNRTGRHLLCTIWQASHMDQSYCLCSDVVFTA